MPWYDLPLERLREYRTSTQEPDGLDDWWAARLREARDQARPATVTAHEPGLYAPFEVSDVEFSGGAGERVRAWYITPASQRASGVVVKFIGYGGGRGVPAEHLLLPALGYPVLVMDSRGQGGRWSSGATADGAGSGPENSLVMTRGITTPEEYYYTRMFTDAALAVDTARELAGPSLPVAVSGGSQGGAGSEPGSVREKPKEAPAADQGSGIRQPSRPTSFPPVRRKVGSRRASSGMSSTSGRPSSSPW